MDPWLLTTPIVFIALLVAVAIIYRLLGALSLPSSPSAGSGKTAAYACGEDVKDHRSQPEYAQFFPFAFFFTIIHVFALVVATVLPGSFSAMAMAVMYAIAAAVGLFILFRE